MDLCLAGNKLYHITELDSFVDTPWVKSFCEHLRKDGYTSFNPFAFLYLNLNGTPVCWSTDKEYASSISVYDSLPFMFNDPFSLVTVYKMHELFLEMHGKEAEPDFTYSYAGYPPDKDILPFAIYNEMNIPNGGLHIQDYSLPSNYSKRSQRYRIRKLVQYIEENGLHVKEIENISATELLSYREQNLHRFNDTFSLDCLALTQALRDCVPVHILGVYAGDKLLSISGYTQEKLSGHGYWQFRTYFEPELHCIGKQSILLCAQWLFQMYGEITIDFMLSYSEEAFDDVYQSYKKLVGNTGIDTLLYTFTDRAAEDIPDWVKFYGL